MQRRVAKIGDILPKLIMILIACDGSAFALNPRLFFTFSINDYRGPTPNADSDLKRRLKGIVDNTLRIARLKLLYIALNRIPY